MSRYLADELAPHGINVVTVHPGMTGTEATTPQVEARPPSNLVGRLIDSTAVVYLVAFLASLKSVAIDGDTIAGRGSVRRVILTSTSPRVRSVGMAQGGLARGEHSTRATAMSAGDSGTPHCTSARPASMSSTTTFTPWPTLVASLILTCHKDTPHSISPTSTGSYMSLTSSRMLKAMVPFPAQDTVSSMSTALTGS